jgi:Fe-S-cluster-containing hydrogenase component 2
VKKLLIDMEKLREYKNIPVEGIPAGSGFDSSLKTIRELATFRYTCRKCEKAPCIMACPADALEKTEKGTINRALYRCIRCKSCVVICPFGTIMSNLFDSNASEWRFLKLKVEKELLDFARCFPEEAVSITEGEEDPAENIFSLNEYILIKEYTWH